MKNEFFGFLGLALILSSAFALTEVDSCMELNTPGETYLLNASLLGNGTSGSCLYITADNVILDCDGYSITGDYGDTTHGIWIDGADGSEVYGCTISNYTHGLLANGSVDSLYVHDCDFLQMSILSSGATGIYLDRVDNSNFSLNLFNDTGDGIFLMNASNISITSSEFYYIGANAKCLRWCDGVSPEGNVENILVQSNNFDYCNDGSAYGVDLDDKFVSETPANNFSIIDNYFGDCYTYLDVGENFTVDYIESHMGWYVNNIGYSTFQNIALSDIDDYFDFEDGYNNTLSNISAWNITGVDTALYFYDCTGSSFSLLHAWNSSPNTAGIHVEKCDDNYFGDIAIWNIDSGTDALSIFDSDRNEFFINLIENISGPNGLYAKELSDSLFYGSTHIENVDTGYALGAETLDNVTFETATIINSPSPLYVSSGTAVMFDSLEIGAVLHEASIYWHSINLTSAGLEAGTNIIYDSYFASLDASDPGAAELNTTAIIFANSSNCFNLRYYVLDGFPTTREDILQNGIEFVPSWVSCVQGVSHSYQVDSFSGYSFNASAPAPSGDDDSEKSMSIEVHGDRMVGEEITIEIMDGSRPVANAEVRILFKVNGILRALDLETDSEGRAFFVPEYEGEYKAIASKSGYHSEKLEFDVAPAEETPECASDSDCTEGLECVSGECVLVAPPPEEPEEKAEEEPEAPAEEEMPPQEPEAPEEQPAEPEQPPAENTTEEPVSHEIEISSPASPQEETLSEPPSPAQQDSALPLFLGGIVVVALIIVAGWYFFLRR